MAGTLLRFTGAMRGLRISWLTVGIKPSCLNEFQIEPVQGNLERKSMREFGHQTAIAVLPEQKAEEALRASCMPEMYIRS